MRYWLNVPYHERFSAKAAGCRWDPEQRLWYVEEPFRLNYAGKPLTLADFKAWSPSAQKLTVRNAQDGKYLRKRRLASEQARSPRHR